MALIRSGSVGTESPYLQYELYTDQTGGSVNNRTIKITLKAKISSGYYGYPANWRANINGTWSGWMKLKGTESWNKNDGFRTFEYSATTNVGTTSSKAITVGFGIDGYGGDDSWDSTITGSFTVGATNRVPNPPSNIIVRNGGSANSPVLSAGIVPENITTLYITWSAGSDPDGDQLTYALNESVNNGGYVQRDFGTDLAHSYTTNGWDEGGTIQFYVDARDTKGAWSSKTYSGVFTKNRLTAGTIYEYSNNIDFNTKSFEARFSGGSNTDKSAVSYSCYSDSITIYNQTYTSDTKQTILIWRTGDAIPASNQPYIKFNELVEVYRSNNFTGTLSMGLFSKNIHGTKKSTVAAVVQVDLRVVPVAPPSVIITGGKAKKTIADSTVYLPNGADDITFSWEASTNPLNAPFSYDLYEVYNGEETKITTVDSNTTSYSYIRPPQLNDIATFAFKVVAITSYGYSNERTSNKIRLEYYNPPTISIGEVARTDTSASVDVLIKINTSIPSVKGIGTWECNNNQKGNITTSSNIKITNLKSDNTYSLIILYNDNSDLSISRRESISIGKNLPIVDINIYGLGVGGYVANTTNALNVKGNAMIDGLLSDSTGRVYTTGNKPTPKDVGALSLSGGTLTGALTIGSGAKLENQKLQSGNCLRINTGQGTVDIGPQNTNYCHFNTSVPNFYYYKPIIMATPSDGVLLRNETGVQVWTCIDMYRNNYIARYGVGGHVNNTYGPTIECWKPNATSFTSRLDITTDRLSFYRPGGDKTFNVFVDSGGHGGISVGSTYTTYLKWLRNTTQLQVRNFADNAYTQIVASSFTQSSRREYKQDIDDIDASIVKDVVMNNYIKTYHLKEEVKEMKNIEAEAQELGFELEEEMTTPNTRAGFILEDLTPEADNLLHPERTEGIDIYAMVSVLWTFCQEQQKEIDGLKQKLGLNP